MTPDRFSKIADAAAEISKLEAGKTQRQRLPLHVRTTSQKTLMHEKQLRRQDSKAAILDHTLRNEEAEGQKFMYKVKE